MRMIRYGNQYKELILHYTLNALIVGCYLVHSQVYEVDFQKYFFIDAEIYTS